MEKSVFKEVMSWIILILSAIIIALFINKFIIVNATVPSGSMENTIMTNDRIVAFRHSYAFSDPKRFDIIVFKYPDNEDILYVKRIIGLPGDTIKLRNGHIYINDKISQEAESYAKDTTDTTLWETKEYHVPANSYFMLGDNRNASEDSRYWKNTYVSKDKILGKVIFKYYKGFKIY